MKPFTKATIPKQVVWFTKPLDDYHRYDKLFDDETRPLSCAKKLFSMCKRNKCYQTWKKALRTIWYGLEMSGMVTI